MRVFRLALIALPLALAGCGVPDLVATGVKSYENGRPDNPAPPAQAAAPAPAPAPAAAKPEPPPPVVGAPMPARAAVTAEPLK